MSCTSGSLAADEAFVSLFTQPERWLFCRSRLPEARRNLKPGSKIDDLMPEADVKMPGKAAVGSQPLHRIQKAAVPGAF